MGRLDRIERVGWNPWSALRGWPDVEIRYEPLPDRDGWTSPYEDHPVIIIDSRIGQARRNAALAHELVHLEREWPCVASWAEEDRVHDEVARRLVPLDELHRWVVTRELDEAQVEVHHVAVEFDVPEPVAERAVRLLLERIRGDIVRHRGW
jgi:hypothetical protein